MAKLTIFHLDNCPYCKKAEKALAALTAGGAYGGVEIEWIEERKTPAVAEQYDYYYVPTVFLGKEKLYECSPADDETVIAARLKDALEKAAKG